MKLLTIAGLAIAVLAVFVSATPGEEAVKPPTHLTGPLGAPFSKPRPTAPSVPPKPLPCHEGKSSCLDFWQSLVCKDGHYAVERCPSKTSCNKKSGKCEAGPVEVRYVVPKMIPGPCEEGESFCTGGLSIVHCRNGLWHHETCPTPGVCHNKKCTDSPHDALVSRSEPEDASVPPKLLPPIGKCTPNSKPRCNAARELVTCDRFGREHTQRCGRGSTCDEGICTFSSFPPTAEAAAYECPGHEGEGACIMSDTLIKCQQGQWQIIKCSAGTHCVNSICGTGDAASQGATPRSLGSRSDISLDFFPPGTTSTEDFWECEKPGEYRCDPGLISGYLFVCSPTYRWRVSANCGSSRSCCENIFPGRAFCTCGPAPFPGPRNIRDEAGNAGTVDAAEKMAREAAAAPETGLLIRGEVGATVTKRESWDCQNPGEAICATSDPFGLTGWDVYLCGADRKWAIDDKCGGPARCCHYRSSSGRAYCSCEPASLESSSTGDLITEETSETPEALSSRAELETPWPGCTTPGQYTCIWRLIDSVVYVCNAMHQWVPSTHCGGPDCCKRGPVEGTAYCACPKTQSSLGEAAGLGSPISVRSINSTMTSESDVSKVEVEARDPPAHKPADIESTPCSTRGEYSCTKGHLFVCTRRKIWKKAAKCGPYGAEACCQNGPEPGTAHCVCAGNGELLGANVLTARRPSLPTEGAPKPAPIDGAPEEVHQPPSQVVGVPPERRALSGSDADIKASVSGQGLVLRDDMNGLEKRQNPPCERPGQYYCSYGPTRSAVVVCDAHKLWELVSYCGGPTCCLVKNDSGYCTC